MQKWLDRLAEAIVPLLFPVLLEHLTKHAERVLKVDINADGVIGFGGNGDVDGDH